MNAVEDIRRNLHGAVEAECHIGAPDIVVDGLRDSDEFHIASNLLRIAGELVHGIHGVVSAHIEEVSDVHLTEVIEDRRVNFTV